MCVCTCVCATVAYLRDVCMNLSSIEEEWRGGGEKGRRGGGGVTWESVWPTDPQ